MGSFIKRKKGKVYYIFHLLGPYHDEKSFITLFKRYYPDDWTKINQKWEKEEKLTKIGKKHPMPCPELYIKEMYRNWKKYF